MLLMTGIDDSASENPEIIVDPKHGWIATPMLWAGSILLGAGTWLLWTRASVALASAAAGTGAVFLMLVAYRLRFPARRGAGIWRIGVDGDGVYIHLDGTIGTASVLFLEWAEVLAAQRCTRNFASGLVRDTYLDLSLAPGVLADLPSRPLVTSPKFGRLVRSGYRVSWDATRLRVALPSAMLEKHPAVEVALKALEHCGVHIRAPRSEFWPVGFDLFRSGGVDDRPGVDTP